MNGVGTILPFIQMLIISNLNTHFSLTQRTYPHNYLILSAFTLCMSYIVGFVCAAYEEAGIGDLVIEALFITATVFIVLTLFTLQSKWDFSFMVRMLQTLQIGRCFPYPLTDGHSHDTFATFVLAATGSRPWNVLVDHDSLGILFHDFWFSDGLGLCPPWVNSL